MSEQVRIVLEPLGKTIAVERGTSLRDVLHAYGVEFPCGGRGRCRGCRVRQRHGSLPAGPEEEDLLSRAEIRDGWRLACRVTVEDDLTLEVGQWQTVILADHSPFDFAPRDGFGVAVDLGTTTIVSQLLDLRTGSVLAVRTALNPQAAHGGDLMTRIQFALEGGQQARLVRGLRRAVGAMVSRLLRSAGLDSRQLSTVVLVGNTVMQHFFCGIDVAPLAHFPFEPDAIGAQRFRASELGWAFDGAPSVRFLPGLGGFVGSDILAGILATKMHESETPQALVDLGTNGEIAIGNRERILCVSTAAGPAFEGGRIGMGMRATTGAICGVTAEAGALRCRVLGDAEPRGICGSGLVDAVAAGLDLGLIRADGRLVEGDLVLAPPVHLTQNDVRELQLAKGAIAAGIRLARARFGDARADRVPLSLAGAFGNYVNRKSARRIGLIDAPDELTRPVGNTALLGAKIALFANDPDEDEFSELRRRVEHLPLAADPDFESAYVEALSFPG